ncbi:Calcineurin-like phosphoesterase [Hyella patelloides LEGE 07179]|uniref:Calcineurin-like phosphoesterase n=1 Tax=Hyella patelloides LEGE 07179 TaxID=945734 RepID=A0A563VPZ0_9CYAN|nr:TIGR04168 family protein [Hyella patelloides]VEP13449.1 Calcineurin-like phosphoesterase [Hyella patelloides LEGE 07179]
MNRGKEQLLIAVIGDIHDRWEEQDNIALEYLGVDLALFVGDFGNESVEIVRTVANLNLPKAVILGNHDAWYTASPWGQKKAPYDRNKEDRVQQQLDILGASHVGYGKLDFPQFSLSVVGGRPFSWGGSDWKNSEFYSDLYNVSSFAESTTKILSAAKDTLCDNLIFIGHNGPLGLGEEPEDTCGKDWGEIGGDHGDPDLTEAMEKTIGYGKSISLVTFGHMHHSLRHRKDRLRTIINTSPEGTVYLNAASVPRIIETAKDTIRNFSLVTLKNNLVSNITLTWLNDDFEVASEEILYNS